MFSSLTFENAGILRNKVDIANNELLELRNVFTTSFTETVCDFDKDLFENTTLTGDPTSGTTPLSVGTTIFLTSSTPEPYWNDEYTATVNGAGDGFTISVPDTSTNFDWILHPNQFFVDSGEGFSSATSYTTSAGAPGFTDIQVDGVFPTLTPSSTRQVKPWGFALATIDAWSDGQIDPGMPKTVKIQLLTGPFAEVVYP